MLIKTIYCSDLIINAVSIRKLIFKWYTEQVIISK